MSWQTISKLDFELKLDALHAQYGNQVFSDVNRICEPPILVYYLDSVDAPKLMITAGRFPKDPATHSEWIPERGEEKQPES